MSALSAAQLINEGAITKVTICGTTNQITKIAVDMLTLTSQLITVL